MKSFIWFVTSCTSWYGSLNFLFGNKIKVIYGIISKKTGLKSDGLPIFSRISLMRAVNELKSRGIQVNIVFIFDEFQRKKIEDSWYTFK